MRTPIRSRFAAAFAAASLAVAAGCGHGHDHPAGAPEAPEPRTAQVTVWHGRWEVFLEHRFLVRGVPARFVTHLTDLETFEPRRGGAVTFLFRHESGSAKEHTESAPAREGIYIPEISLDQAGRWEASLRIPHEGKDHDVPLPPYTVHGTEADALAAPEPDALEGITFLKEQAWRLGVRTAEVESGSVVEHRRAAGVVAVRAGARSRVAPPVAGRLVPPPGGRLPAPGERVEKGQVLAVVEPPFSVDLLQPHLVESGARAAGLEGEAEKALLEKEQAERTLARVERLAAEGARPQRDLEEARTAAASARLASATADAAREAFRRVAGTYASVRDGAGGAPRHPPVEVRAPIAGIVIEATFAEGEHVAPESILFTVLDASSVLVVARVSEHDLPLFDPARGGAFSLPSIPSSRRPLPGPDGRLAFVGLEVDERTRTVPVAYEVPNADGALRIGMALDVALESGSARDAVVLPAEAVVEEEGLPAAFVQVAGETFERRPLRLGIRDGDRVQVLSGVKPGERVATEGAFAVRLASLATALPEHGHAH